GGCLPQRPERHAGAGGRGEGLRLAGRDLRRVPPGLRPVPRADHFLNGSRGTRTMSEAIRVTKATTLKPKPKDAELGFGQIFTDHMFLADLQEEKGWYDPRVEPYGPLAMDSAVEVILLVQSILADLLSIRAC